MALVTELRHLALQSRAQHQRVDCTFDVVVDDGKKFLQLDTYGSVQRQIPGKKSQSLRLSPAAIQQLKDIFREYDL